MKSPTLSGLQAEVEKREQRLDGLQERVTELKERAKLQETPLQMQVNVMAKREIEQDFGKTLNCIFFQQFIISYS